MLKTRAAGLAADSKQKISLGRGLVRDDVNVIMFDEPLTVIDPHLKWKLRSKLKELHQKVRRDDDLRHPRPDRGADLRRPGGGDAGRRDRADRLAGRAVRAPGPHLRRPFHRLARHERAALRGARRRRLLPRPATSRSASGVGHTAGAAAARDRGPARIRELRRERHPGRGGQGRRCRAPPDRRAQRRWQPRSTCWRRPEVRSPRARSMSASIRPSTRVYADGWLAEHGRTPDGKTDNQKGLVLRPAGDAAGRVQRPGAADDGGQLLGAGDLRQQRVLLARCRLVRGRAALRAVPRRAGAADPVHRHDPGHRDAARASPSRWRCRRRGPGCRSAWC